MRLFGSLLVTRGVIDEPRQGKHPDLDGEPEMPRGGPIQVRALIVVGLPGLRKSIAPVADWRKNLDKFLIRVRPFHKKMSPERLLGRAYDEHAQALFAFLLNLLRDEADTNDVLQDLFCRIARKPESLMGARDERAFLIRLARNQAIDLIRRRETRRKHGETLATEGFEVFASASDPDEATFRVALANAMSELPVEQREVIHLKLWEDRTFEAIADALEIPLNTAASRYRYGIDKLRDHLRPLYDEIV